MKVSIVKGATSVLLRIFIQDSSSTTGAGLAGLAFNTAGLTCYRMRDDDGNAGATAISLATATLGTWAAGGFKEKDATNAPGWYEFGVTNAAIATGSRTVGVHLKGATNMAPLPIEIELTGWDNQDGVRGGMTALPNAAAEAAGGLYTRGTGAGQIAQDANGNVRVNVDTIKANAVVNGGTVTFPTNATLASTTNIAAGTIATVTTVTNQLTAAAIATGIWQDATAGDFTAANSIGKSVMNGVALGTGLTVARVTLADTLTTYTGNTVQTGDAFARIGANGAGLTAVVAASVTGAVGNVTGAVGSISGITFPTNFSALSITAGGAVLLSASGSVALTKGLRANAAQGTLGQILYEILLNITEQNNAGTTRTVNDIDHSSPVATYTYDSATPNTITRTT